MARFQVVVEAYVASRELDQASLSRLAFWVDELGDREVAAITADDIDAAMLKLAERGRLKAGRNMTAAAAGRLDRKPLPHPSRQHLQARQAPETRAAQLHRAHTRHRACARAADPERYLRPEEVERLLAVSRVMDRTWGKMPALITVAYHSGLRVGSILRVRGRDLDLDAGTLTVARTKNGDPITAGLSSAALAELKRLPKVGQEELIFGNRSGKSFTYRPLWRRIAKEARLDGRVFHELRHGHGYQLARNGVSQQMIMQSMGHKTLSASARYAHASVADKKPLLRRCSGEKAKEKGASRVEKEVHVEGVRVIVRLDEKGRPRAAIGPACWGSGGDAATISKLARGEAYPMSAESVAQALGGKKSGNEYVVRCVVPGHEDNNPSLYITDGKNGGIVVRWPRRLRKRGLWPAAAAKTKPQREVSATYPHEDENHAVLYEVVRYKPKDFRQRRPDGKGGWLWSMGDIERVPFRLPDVKDAIKAKEIIFVCEGEKDCDNLANTGITATTNPGGAGKCRTISLSTSTAAPRSSWPPTTMTLVGSMPAKSRTRSVTWRMSASSSGPTRKSPRGSADKGTLSDSPSTAYSRIGVVLGRRKTATQSSLYQALDIVANGI